MYRGCLRRLQGGLVTRCFVVFPNLAYIACLAMLGDRCTAYSISETWLMSYAT
jgi:hypothetical protein